jgi:glycosyltransferase involved in cell wall biosynthesis
MISKSDITVVIPAYNEAPVIGQVIRRILDCGFARVVVVNDGSRDDTATVARQAGATVLSHRINRGAGAAAQTGISYARRRGFPYLVQIDADGQHYPEDIEAMAARMAETDCDIVIGSRWLGRNTGVPATRIAYNRISNLFTNFFCRSRYTDSQSGMRLLNRKTIEALHLHLDGFGYCSEMIVQAEERRLKIEEVPIRVAYTEYSMSKGQDLQMGITTAMNLLWKLIFQR